MWHRTVYSALSSECCDSLIGTLISFQVSFYHEVSLNDSLITTAVRLLISVKHIPLIVIKLKTLST